MRTKMEEIKITNPDKIIYPKDKITKLDVVNYYVSVAKIMLPFVKDRLLSVIRCHEGVNKDIFFKKHPNADTNVHIKKDGNEDYFFIKDELELVYQVQLGTLEFHTWASEVQKLEKPNVMVFDLDPDENLTHSNVVEAVQKVKSVLEELSLQSFLKTSGGKGYHIVVPFEDVKNWDTFYAFAKLIAELVESKYSKIFTTNIKKAERHGKIFVDYLRNSRGATCVCPYSLRARENAGISMPIAWDDLDKIKPNEVTIKNYEKYINNSWQNFFSLHQKIK